MNNQPHAHELQVWRGAETTCVSYGDQSRYLHRIYPCLWRWLSLVVPHPLPLDVRIRMVTRRLVRQHDRSFGIRRDPIWTRPRIAKVPSR